ncbi:MAG: YfhO family protein [Acidobacteriota bacterium]
MAGRRPWVVLFFAVLALVAIAPTLVPDRVFGFRDLLVYSLPMKILARRTIAAGAFPWRNPYVACGNPFFANPEAQILYPPAWGYFAFGLWGGSLVFYISHLMIGALGAWALARRLEASPLGALVAGTAFGFGGVAESVLELQNVMSDRFIPAILLAALSVRARPALRGIVGLAALEAVMAFGGEPSLSLLTHLIVMGIVLSADAPWPARIGLVAGQGALVAWAALAQLLPTVRYVVGTERWRGMEASDVAQWGVAPVEVLELVLPGLFRGPMLSKLAGAQSYLPTIYAGALTVALATAAASLRARVVAIGGLSATFLLLALGGATPLHGLFAAITLHTVRYPARLMTFVSLGVALLAGEGVARVLSWPRRAAACLFGGAVAAGLPIAFAGRGAGPIAANLRTAAWHAALVLGLGTLACALATRRPAAGGVLLAFAVSADLLFAPGHDHLYTVPASALERPACAAPWMAALEGGRYRAMPVVDPPALLARTLSRDPDEQPRAVTEVAWGLSGVLCGVRSAAPEPVLPLALYAAWLQDRTAPLALLARASVREILTLGPEGQVLSKEIAARPRVSLATASLRDPGGDAARALLRELPLGTVLVAGGADTASLGSGDVVVREDGPARIRLRVRLDRDGVLVVTERWEPAWRAAIDGRPAPVNQADGMFLAIPLAGGEHEVELRYVPQLERAALWICALFWIGAACAPILARSRVSRPSVP